MAKKFRKKHIERIIARRRIERLFELAHRRTVDGEPALADRSVALARRIAMRYQTGLKAHERDRLCRACGTYLAPGANARVRVAAGKKSTTCLRCGAVQRRPYRTEQKARRQLAAHARGAAPAPTPTPTPVAGGR